MRLVVVVVAALVFLGMTGGEGTEDTPTSTLSWQQRLLAVVNQAVGTGAYNEQVGRTSPGGYDTSGFVFRMFNDASLLYPTAVRAADFPGGLYFREVLPSAPITGGDVIKFGENGMGIVLQVDEEGKTGSFAYPSRQKLSVRVADFPAEWMGAFRVFRFDEAAATQAQESAHQSNIANILLNNPALLTGAVSANTNAGSNLITTLANNGLLGALLGTPAVGEAVKTAITTASIGTVHEQPLTPVDYATDASMGGGNIGAVTMVRPDGVDVATTYRGQVVRALGDTFELHVENVVDNRCLPGMRCTTMGDAEVTFEYSFSTLDMEHKAVAWIMGSSNQPSADKPQSFMAIQDGRPTAYKVEVLTLSQPASAREKPLLTLRMTRMKLNQSTGKYVSDTESLVSAALSGGMGSTLLHSFDEEILEDYADDDLHDIINVVIGPFAKPGNVPFWTTGMPFRLNSTETGVVQSEGDSWPDLFLSIKSIKDTRCQPGQQNCASQGDAIIHVEWKTCPTDQDGLHVETIFARGRAVHTGDPHMFRAGRDKKYTIEFLSLSWPIAEKGKTVYQVVFRALKGHGQMPEMCSHFQEGAGVAAQAQSLFYAKQVTYALGGRGPEAFDSSGFVWFDYHTSSLKYPYMASQEFRSSENDFFDELFSVEEVCPGDVITYGYKGNPTGMGVVTRIQCDLPGQFGGRGNCHPSQCIYVSPKRNTLVARDLPIDWMEGTRFWRHKGPLFLRKMAYLIREKWRQNMDEEYARRREEKDQALRASVVSGMSAVAGSGVV